MSGMLSDFAQSARRLISSPGFTLATVLSIGLGVGVNASVFTAANELLIKPLGVPESHRLVRIYRGHHSPLSGGELRFLQGARSFAYVFGETSLGVSLVVGDGDPERVRALLASDNFFQGLRVQPAAGRFFTGNANEREPTLVISHEFWLRRFGGNVEVIGQPVRVNDRVFTVVGVTPPHTSSAQVAWYGDVLVPTRHAPLLVGVPADSLGGTFYTTARLAAGTRIDAANAELRVLSRQLAQADSNWRNVTLRALPARGLTEELRAPITVASALLIAVAALLLLMAATNVGNLMLARNAARKREIAVRLALGAPRGRLVRLLICEALLLCLIAGLIAWWLAALVAGALPSLLPPDGEVRLVLQPDWRVLLCSALTLGVAILIFGLIPARIAARQDVTESIKESSTIGHGVQGTRTRRRFLLAQVAICALLLSVGSLFVRSLGNAKNVDIGFQPAGVVTANVDLSVKQNADTAQRDFFDRILREVTSLPGVQSATYSAVVELTSSKAETGLYSAAATDSSRANFISFNTVGPRYLETLKIPLVAGRDFSNDDRAGSTRVTIVNERLAEREWPGQSALGKRVSIDGPNGPWYTVVGVSRTAKYHTLSEDPVAFAVFPYTQLHRSSLTLEARVAPGADEGTVMRRIARVVREADPTLPPGQTASLLELQTVTLLPMKAGAAILGGIGLFGFLLAAVGVSGVAAYAVAQRRREIGLRAALGASPSALLRHVLGDTGRIVLVGSVVGLVLAAGAAKAISGLLVGVSVIDPATFILVPCLLALLAAIATFVPARRALAVSATEALRAD